MKPIEEQNGAIMVGDSRHYWRLGKFAIDDVLDSLPTPAMVDRPKQELTRRGFTRDCPKYASERKLHILGVTVKLASQRYAVFKLKGTVCAECGLGGEFFGLERDVKILWNQRANPFSFHFNLYGYNGSGEEVMLTKDHIVPKSGGGPNTLANYQTLCAPCNEEKKNVHPK